MKVRASRGYLSTRPPTVTSSHRSTTMEFSISDSSPTNTVLSTETQAVYFISTPTTLTNVTTTISRAVEGGGSSEVAKLYWHSFRSDEFMFGGQLYKFSEFMQRSGFFREYVALLLYTSVGLNATLGSETSWLTMAIHTTGR